jgi:hypothetical protein
VGVIRINDADVTGDCPACGHPTLFLGAGGYVTCSLIDCPDPEAATKLLEGSGIMKPSVGRVVHYVSHGTPVREDGTQAYPAVCRAAVITSVENAPVDPERVYLIEDGYDVGMCVLNPTGLFFNEHVPYEQWDSTEAQPGAQPPPGTWHWPERES